MSVSVEEINIELQSRNYFSEDDISVNEKPENGEAKAFISPQKIMLIFGALVLLALFPGEESAGSEVQNANSAVTGQ